MAAQCRLCAAGWEHCHGTVIRHSSRNWECTHDCAQPDLIAHVFVVDCDVVGCVCAQPIGSATAAPESARG